MMFTKAKLVNLLRSYGGTLVEGLLVLLCLLLMAQSVHALPAQDETRIDLEYRDTPLWYEPAVYSLRVMGIGITGLVGLDLHHEDPSRANFERVFTSPLPRKDDDGPMFNLVLHPLWGSETYLRARSAGMSKQESFAFSMTASVVWEYLIESWTEHPSSQDLIYTTGIGWMIGEGRHYLLQNLDQSQHIWVDPIYSLMSYVDLSASVTPEGDLHPVVGIGWQFQ